MNTAYRNTTPKTFNLPPIAFDTVNGASWLHPALLVDGRRADGPHDVFHIDGRNIRAVDLVLLYSRCGTASQRELTLAMYFVADYVEQLR